MSGLNWERQKELAKLRMDRAEGGDEKPWLVHVKFREGALKGMPKEARLSIPNCPDCHRPMVIKSRHSDGKRFFGCRNYPDCKQTQDIVKGR